MLGFRYGFARSDLIIVFSQLISKHFFLGLSNRLIFGEGANLDGTVTPIISNLRGFYYISLEGISVGEEKLKINPDVFKIKPSGHGGTFIDSGSTLTSLTASACDLLHDKVRSLLGASHQRISYRGKGVEMLCYKGIVVKDFRNFPAVTFHFARGADILLDPHSLFLQMLENAFGKAVFSIGCLER